LQAAPKGRAGKVVDVVEAFTLDVAVKVSGLTVNQLRELDALEIIRPTVAPWEPYSPPLYSFRDLIKARLAAEMWRRDLPPTRIARLIAELGAKGIEEPLLTVRFIGDEEGGRVFIVDGTSAYAGRHVDQKAEVYDLTVRDLRTGIEGTLDQLRRRQPGRIEKVRGVQGSEPVVAGTRVPASKIKLLHAQGWSIGRILRSFPGLMRADVEAAIQHHESTGVA
jgi:uncharacterized protein (DUF433 family)